MADSMNILDARNNLSRLVSAAEHGTDTVIARRGRAVARITSVADDAKYSAATVIAWLAEHPVAASAARTSAELDDQIRAEREAWE